MSHDTSTAPASLRERTSTCRCVTRWCFDRQGDGKMERTTAYTAVVADGLGIKVMLMSVPESPMRPILIEGVQYADGYRVGKLCPVCGYETGE